ncbi:Uncharacterized RING finger protein [Morus notabilis]|uniref:Uncharacterized RING finger protein n=1 Tax=Morus notabilis TaxID=981085 RepID=W9R9U8_9ROSA|nr:Uncharacterized RING finger protein [Morus notabilis]
MHILIHILHLLWLIIKAIIYPLKRDETPSDPYDEDLSHYDDEEEDYYRFSASLIKKQLPMMSYGSFLQRETGKVSENDNDNICIVCLSGIEARHEVRVPFNCCHVFHRECLDAWIDQGRGTCPLCRSKLCNIHDHHYDQYPMLGYY